MQPTLTFNLNPNHILPNMLQLDFQNPGTLFLCGLISLGVTWQITGLLVALLKGATVFLFTFLISTAMATGARRAIQDNQHNTTKATLQEVAEHLHDDVYVDAAPDERMEAWRDSVTSSGSWSSFSSSSSHSHKGDKVELKKIRKANKHEDVIQKRLSDRSFGKKKRHMLGGRRETIEEVVDEWEMVE